MGKLYIVATPIGNLKDITLRALEVLKSVDYVLCEDTRVTGKLLSHFEIKRRLESFNDFNEEKKESNIVKDLTSGQSIALVCDAGTPLISDPGYKLVRSVIHQGIKVESIPGVSSVITALTVSGLPPDKFTFLGYLPKSEEKKKKVLEFVKENRIKIKSTIMIFESPFRLLKTLDVIREVFGVIEVVICRELTKIHEEVKRTNLEDTIKYFAQKSVKGELIILF